MHRSSALVFFNKTLAPRIKFVSRKEPVMMMKTILLSLWLVLVLSALTTTRSLVVPSPPTTTTKRSLLAFRLWATKKKKTRNSSAFGGASMEPCPCGSLETYSRCCGRIHKDVNAFKSATASDIVRARYSAYAKKQAEFLMASTHPLHKDFDTDLKRWKDKIKENMFDNFDLNKCHVLEEDYFDEGETKKATVKFVAEMVLRESGEVTGFMETSQFERAKTHGGWLYLNGTIDGVPDDLLVKNLDTNSRDD